MEAGAKEVPGRTRPHTRQQKGVGQDMECCSAAYSVAASLLQCSPPCCGQLAVMQPTVLRPACWPQYAVSCSLDLSLQTASLILPLGCSPSPRP